MQRWRCWPLLHEGHAPWPQKRKVLNVHQCRACRLYDMATVWPILNNNVATFPPWNDYFFLKISGTAAKSQPAFKSSDDILSKTWGCVRDSNGIKVLLSLLMVKKSLVDADCIRALACKALCGLSRSDAIRQVMGKHQIFKSGPFQSKYLVHENQAFFLLHV